MRADTAGSYARRWPQRGARHLLRLGVGVFALGVGGDLAYHMLPTWPAAAGELAHVTTLAGMVVAWLGVMGSAGAGRHPADRVAATKGGEHEAQADHQRS